MSKVEIIEEKPYPLRKFRILHKGKKYFAKVDKRDSFRGGIFIKVDFDFYEENMGKNCIDTQLEVMKVVIDYLLNHEAKIVER